MLLSFMVWLVISVEVLRSLKFFRKWIIIYFGIELNHSGLKSIDCSPFSDNFLRYCNDEPSFEMAGP